MITTTEDPTSNLTIILRVYPIYGSLRSQTTLCLCYNCLAQSFYIPLLQLYLLSFTPYNLPTTSPRSLAFSPPLLEDVIRYYYYHRRHLLFRTNYLVLST